MPIPISKQNRGNAVLIDRHVEPLKTERERKRKTEIEIERERVREIKRECAQNK